jgi:1-acyl-sn-glycerol-3-phosphate acyltransferase
MTDVPLKHGCYKTPPDMGGWFSSLFPSLCFYPRCVWITFRCASMAKRGLYDREAWRSSSADVMRALEKVGCRFAIEGADHLGETDGPCVIVGNHMSTLETMILPGLVVPYREVTFVVKQSLVEYPVFKHVMRSCNPITVARKSPRADLKAMLDGGSERLQAGISIVVFPQGERAPRFNPNQFNSAGVMLARRAGVPIVPVALKTDAWNNGKWIMDFGWIEPSRRVRFAFGKPLRVTGRGAEQQASIIEFIQSHLDRWQAEDGSRSVEHTVPDGTAEGAQGTAQE